MTSDEIEKYINEVAFSGALKSIKNPENDNIQINIYKPNLIVDKKNNFF